jgi:hypothetical protein
MSANAPAWPRPQWRDSGAQALLLWFVFGDFDAEFRIDAPRYRTRGTPPGVDVVRYANRNLARWEGYPLGGTLGRLLREENPRLFERACKAGECVMLRGSVSDPPDLDGLRDLIGTIAAMTDLGAIAIVDPQTLSMTEGGEWRARYFDKDVFAARDHVLILAKDDERNAGRVHVHTRGLRKFARADISLRNVPKEMMALAGQLAERFVEFQALGGIVEDGREIELEGAPGTMRVRRAGALDDPEFNNVHLAMRWPD